MMVAMRTIWGLLVLAACSSSGSTSVRTVRTVGTDGTNGIRPESPPLRVALGDCALPTAAFVSGPRPLPFAFDKSDAKVPPAERGISGEFVKIDFDDILSSDLEDKGKSKGVYGGRLDPSQGTPGGIGIGIGSWRGTGGSGGSGGSKAGVPAVPTVSIGQPTVQGDLDKAIVRRYVKRNQHRIDYCYEAALLAKPTIGGTIVATYTIEATGSVTDVKATGVDPYLSSCIEKVIKAIEYPKPRSGGVVKVSYPLVFRSGREQAAAPPA